MDVMVATVGAVRALGMETCMTFGMLRPEQSFQLANAELNHPITSAIPPNATNSRSPPPASIVCRDAAIDCRF